jgi:hypothetical protein
LGLEEEKDGFDAIREADLEANEKEAEAKLRT